MVNPILSRNRLFAISMVRSNYQRSIICTKNKLNQRLWITFRSLCTVITFLLILGICLLFLSNYFFNVFVKVPWKYFIFFPYCFFNFLYLRLFYLSSLLPFLLSSTIQSLLLSLWQFYLKNSPSYIIMVHLSLRQHNFV